jgi:hypothetical protein
MTMRTNCSFRVKGNGSVLPGEDVFPTHATESALY